MKLRHCLLLAIGVINSQSAWAQSNQELAALAPKDRAVIQQLLQIDQTLAWSSGSTAHVTMIGFGPKGSTDKAIALLPDLTELKVLQIHKQFNDAVADWKPGNLAPLARCGKLRELFLVIGKNHSAETWRTLPTLEQVTTVHLFDESPGGMPVLGRFPRATQVVMRTSGSPRLDGDQFGNLSQLRSLSLYSRTESWHGDGLKHLNVCPRLEELSIGGTGMSDIALTEIAGVPSIKRLTLRTAKVTRDGLAQLHDLESFRCTEALFTDDMAMGLVNCRNLKTLELSGTAVTGRCFEVLSQLPLEEIVCAGLKTGNLHLLKQCKTLRRLEVSVRTKDDMKLQQTLLSNLLPDVDLKQNWMGEKGAAPKSGR